MTSSWKRKPTIDPRICRGVSRGKPVEITVDGAALCAYEGETIGAALAASGMRRIRHAPRNQDSRGLYCCTGACYGCLVTVDGRPNVRACITPVEAGQEIVLQDGYGRFDPGAPLPEPGAVRREKVQILVVGTGPAGLSAAIEAAKYGAKSLMIDENPLPGGQIYRRLPEPFTVGDPDVLGPDYTDGKSLIAYAAVWPDHIRILNDAVVWGVFEDRRIAVVHQNVLMLIEAEAIIVAAGAYERPYPVSGWTLPGVMTAGGAQTLIKGQRIRPGNRVLLAGTGPLQLVVANQMLDAGMAVAAVAEASSARFPVRHLFDLMGRFDLLKQGVHYLFRLKKAGVPVLPSHVLKAVEGKERVHAAVLCKVDSRSRPIPGTEKRYDVDTVCIGYGLIPNAWSTQMLDCTHEYVEKTGAWIPLYDDTMETDRAGVFVAGDGAGVAGVLTARCQGAIAGLYAAAHCGVVSVQDAAHAAEPFRKKRAGLKRFRRAMDTIYPIHPGLYSNITDDTLVCRCEGVTAGEIRRAIKEGTTDPNDIKKRTRAGMGYCQGLHCFPTIAMILAREFGAGPETVKRFTPRPPARPIPLHLLMADLSQ